MARNDVRIEHFRVRGYRSCLTTSLKPTPALTVLIGRNGSGKTNVLQALVLLGSVGVPRHRRPRTESRPSRCFLQAAFNVRGKVIPYRAWVSYVTNERNEDEVVHAREQWNFREVNNTDQWQEIPSGFLHEPLFIHRRFIAPHATGRLGRNFQLALDKPYSVLPKKVIDTMQAIGRFISQITYYSASQFTNPSRCPSSFEIDEDGDLRAPQRITEHLRFMFDLYKASTSEPLLYEQYMSIVGRNGLSLIDWLTWRKARVASSVVEVTSGGKLIRERRERVLIIPNVHIGRSHLSMNQLSEGTFKTLALLFYLVHDRSGLLLVEEPEVCVHHGLLRSVMEIITRFSRDRQIICSTHSDFVLDLLRPEQVMIVRNEGIRGTQVKSVSQRMSVKELAALRDYLSTEGNLGEFWRHGGLER